MPSSFSQALAGLLTATLAASLLVAPAVSASPAYQQVFNDPASSYILVFAYPSASWLDWSSPSNLARTSVNSTLAKRFFDLPTTIGHAQIAWSCRDNGGTLLSHGASGQSGENNGQSLASLSRGWGMSILEFVYNDGELEYEQEVDARIRNGAEKNQFSWAGFKVPVKNCLQMAEFVEQYQKAEAFKNYGFPVDPLKFQGAGCTSYANAAVAKSGAAIPIRDTWVRSYEIPEDQLGRNGAPPSHTVIVPQARIPGREKQIGLNEFLFGNLTWAKAGEKSIHFSYYDPELFYESFNHLENDYRQAHGLPLKTATRTPTLDEFQQKLKAKADAWMKELQAKKTPMELDEIAGTSGLVIDLRG